MMQKYYVEGVTGGSVKGCCIGGIKNEKKSPRNYTNSHYAFSQWM